jgi:hypothetical protein
MSDDEEWTIKEGDHVALTKRTTVRVPDGYVEADVKPEGYELKGHVLVAPEKDRPLLVSRYERNGVQVSGLFNTSPVKMVTYQGPKVAFVHTENSVWRVELLEQKEE